MRVVITGCAGFIGSTLADAALAEGHTVIGIDNFTDYYDVASKRAAIGTAIANPSFTLVEQDLSSGDLGDLFTGADVVHHLAGQPGVRLSWSRQFPDYVSRNIIATQRVLEAARQARPGRVVFASSSSVYGNAAEYPTTEQALPQPHSPYGVTKLAAEHLCGLYAANWNVPTVSLRYFTVYGPRQRPDMGLHRFIEAIRAGEPLPLYGDGEQIRDFTFVHDVVRANLAAGSADVAPGSVFNVAGAEPITVNHLLSVLGAAAGREVDVTRLAEQPGDVRQTGGSIERAVQLLGWEPATGIAAGVAAQYEWQTAAEPSAGGRVG